IWITLRDSRRGWPKRKPSGRQVKLEGRKFVAFHKYFEYLASDFGFNISSYVEEKPGIPPSAAHIQKLISTMKEEKIEKILTTSYSSKREVGFIAEKTGAKIITLPHDVGSKDGISNWFDLIDSVLDSLK
ncbi:zinc ABC transporter substrate-binding protein, partial [bacterium]|nr:zinc ABC transporter substrate-binding protein [bacterium]